MSSRLLAVILTVIALTGWSESIPRNGAFIFIEQKPPSTSEDKTARSTAVYLTDNGLVQRYACEDYQIKELKETTLPVTDLFKTLPGISLKSLPNKQDADPNLPPSQAQPGHTHIMLRQSGGANYQWEGASSAVPSGLQKLVQEALALVSELPAGGGSALGGKTAGAPVGDFVRADILIADRLDEYRVGKLLKTVKTSDKLDPVLREALANPFRLVPVPAGVNPFSAFSIKGEASPLPLLYNETGYEINRYSFLASAEPLATCPPSCPP